MRTTRPWGAQGELQHQGWSEALSLKPAAVSMWLWIFSVRYTWSIRASWLTFTTALKPWFSLTSTEKKKKKLCTLFANALWYRLVFYRADCFLLDLETRQMGFMNKINQEAISKKPLLAAICMPDTALKIATWQWEKMTRIDVLFNSTESHYFRRTRIHK